MKRRGEFDASDKTPGKDKLVNVFVSGKTSATTVQEVAGAAGLRGFPSSSSGGDRDRGVMRRLRNSCGMDIPIGTVPLLIKQPKRFGFRLVQHPVIAIDAYLDLLNRHGLLERTILGRNSDLLGFGNKQPGHLATQTITHAELSCLVPLNIYGDKVTIFNYLKGLIIAFRGTLAFKVDTELSMLPYTFFTWNIW